MHGWSGRSRRPFGGVLAAGLALGALGAFGGSPAPAAAQAPGSDGRTEVYVLATLYRRHAEAPAYGHDTLRVLLERIAPDAVVLDVSPRELREQQVHPGKAEYPEVIFPFVRARGVPAYAGEPGEPDFGRIVGALGRSLEAFGSGRPEASRVDAAYERATWAALAEIWRSPADVNGALTDRLIAARRAVQDRLAGERVAEAWREWHEHAVAAVRRAAAAHPGGRVLVLIGVENAGRLRRALAEVPDLRLVDVEAWLRTPSGS